MTTKTKTKKVGNAECVLCGLRASSKNVAIRSVFPIWAETDSLQREPNEVALEMLESCVRVTDKDEQTFFGMHKGVHAEQRAKGKTDAWVFAQWIKEVVRIDPELKHLNKLLCAHQWRQDPGTETV